MTHGKWFLPGLKPVLRLETSPQYKALLIEPIFFFFVKVKQSIMSLFSFSYSRKVVNESFCQSTGK